MNRKAILRMAFLAVAIRPGAAQTQAAPAARSKPLADFAAAMEDLARSASPAVVQIRVRTLAPVGKEDTQRAGFVSEQEATGSGVIVDPEGYIVTTPTLFKTPGASKSKCFGATKRAKSRTGTWYPPS
jgi:S1-C subfamily serine protease